jgi:putative selenate reductase
VRLQDLAKVYGLGDPDGFVFNMSVGYDLAGIRARRSTPSSTA